MRFLLDTNVVAELRKLRRGKADPNVALWADRIDAADLHLSTITIIEIEVGVLRLERQDPRQGAVLRSWLEMRVMAAFEGRILPVDFAVARRCASLHVPDRRPAHDALIAATALVHGMTMVTRNVADFAPTGVALLNPWLAA